MAKKPVRKTSTAKTRAPKRKPLEKTHFPIVGIGASAGGLDAFKRLFDAMPSDIGAAFVLVQHLDPLHKSHTHELLARHSDMPMIQARNAMRVEPNHVYVIPPDTDLAAIDGELRLTRPTQRRGLRLPIDFLFRSLADSLHEKAICIVLSGAGSDGSLGLKAVEAGGGMTLVQTPETAQYDGMPRSAIATGAVDHVLPVEKMPKVIANYLRHSYVNGVREPAVIPEAEPDYLKSTLNLLRARTGHNFDFYKKNTLARRVQRRMGLLHIEEGSRYLNFLRENADEASALFKDLFIGVTDFFRDAEAWEALADHVIKPLCAKKDVHSTLRVWIPGCATGEEAYSLAILILEELRRSEKSCKVQIFASDIDPAALDVARKAVYSASIAAHVNPERLRKFFTPLDENRYEVDKRVREMVMFATQNLVLDPPFSRLDLIVCRNLLIYIEPETQKKLISLFHFGLLEDGALFLGSAETIGTQDDLFKPIAKRWRIFQRIGPARHDRIDFAPTSGEGAPRAEHEPRPAPPGAKIAALAQAQLLERFIPASVLIDQKCNILYYWGPTQDYLVQPPGTPSSDLLTTARERLRTQLRSAVRRAIRDERDAVARVARVKRNGGFHSVTITVNPVRSREFGNLFLVTFEDRKTEKVKHNDDAAGDESLVQQLEAELKITRDDLQSNIEQLESSNEELKAANEEVTSINEELQSTNEELETSKEELQSLNEELSTVNNQLQGQLEQVENVNNDLRNLLVSTDVATIFLDNTFRIKRFTPAMTQLLPLAAGDVGRLLSDFSQKFTDRDLLFDSQSVLETLTPRAAEVKTDDGRWYNRRVLPYRTGDNRISGVVVTFSDITLLKAEQERANDAMEKLEGVNQRLEERVTERTAAAERSNYQLRALASELALTEERERQKLSIDLHEGLAQNLTLAKVKLSALAAELTGRDAKRQVESIDELLSAANESVRSHIFSLSPPVLHDLGLEHALAWLAEELQTSFGLKVTVEHEGKTNVTDERIRFTLFRAIRELLVNVIKHSGVDEARLVLHARQGKVIARVEDRGKGFDPVTLDSVNARGFGLFSIRERLSYLGGQMSIQTAHGEGTKITLIAPTTSGRSR